MTRSIDGIIDFRSPQINTRRSLAQFIWFLYIYDVTHDGERNEN